MSVLSDRVVLRPISIVVFCSLAAVVSLVGFIALGASGPGPDPSVGDYIGPADFGVALFVLFARATRMRAQLDDVGVTVFGYFTTRLVSWSQLADVSADYGGLRLWCTNGDVVTVATMGKPNWSTWTHRRVRADDRVDLIEAEMMKRRADLGST